MSPSSLLASVRASSVATRASSLAVVLAVCAMGLVAFSAVAEPSAADREELLALRDEVETLTERAAADERRISDLEASAERLEREDPLARVDATDAELTRLVDALTVLEEDVAAAVADGAQQAEDAAADATELRAETAELRDALEEVRGQVGTIRGQVEGVGGEVAELRTLYTTLRDRLDRLQRGS